MGYCVEVAILGMTSNFDRRRTKLSKTLMIISMNEALCVDFGIRGSVADVVNNIINC